MVAEMILWIRKNTIGFVIPTKVRLLKVDANSSFTTFTLIVRSLGDDALHEIRPEDVCGIQLCDQEEIRDAKATLSLMFEEYPHAKYGVMQ
jgi:hypothetical protein